jgi:hypothetical protein
VTRVSKNPWVGVNYLDLNSKMAIPPAFWLQRLSDFDADLVVFPSFHMPYAYVLARRARRSKGLDGAQALIDTCGQPDTVACLQRGLVPVTMIIRQGTNWDIDNILRGLAARDIWRHGGPEKVADMLDAQDEQERAARRAQSRDDMYNRAGDAWRSYKARTGASTIRFNDRRPLKPTRSRNVGAPTDKRSSGSTAGSGITLTD